MARFIKIENTTVNVEKIIHISLVELSTGKSKAKISIAIDDASTVDVYYPDTETTKKMYEEISSLLLRL